jgi:DNA-binding beta-propeller fold protein YncE
MTVGISTSRRRRNSDDTVECSARLPWHRKSLRVALAVGVLLALPIAACSGQTARAVTPLFSAPEPAVSPPAQAQLPGTIVPLGGAPEGVAIDQAGVVGVNVRGPDALVLFPLATPTDRRLVSLGGSARHLTLAGIDGPFLVPDESNDQLVEVASSGAIVQSVPVGRQPHDAIAVGASIFVADEFGNTIHIISAGRVVRVVPAPLQPGGMAASPDGSTMLAVGVRGRRITEYRQDGTIVGSANCGAGPTHAVTGNGGFYWVADTNGGAVLGFRMGPRGPVQVATIPVGSRPYGIAFDASRSILWVTLTGSNQLVGLRLDGKSVVHRVTFATVRQPNTVAVDAASGEVVVTGSGTQGSLQIITP